MIHIVEFRNTCDILNTVDNHLESFKINAVQYVVKTYILLFCVLYLLVIL